MTGKNPQLKRVLILFFLFSLFFILASTPVKATDVGANYSINSGLTTRDLRDIVISLVRIFLSLLSIIAVIIIIYGGFVWMTSGGNAEKVEKAQRIIRDAVIGLIIILCSLAIVVFVLGNAHKAANPNGPGGPGGPPGGIPGGGALGNGIIQDHYPGRDATNIPRNTKIAITFKEPMDITTILHDGGTPNNFADDTINSSIIRIMKKSDYDNQGPTAPALADVHVTHTPDNKIFVFHPDKYLGSPSEDVWYVVYLTGDLHKMVNNNSVAAFNGIFDHYDWKFQVSTKIDLDPPYVIDEEVIPPTANRDNVPMNAVVSLTFSEPIDPTTIGGITQTAQNGNNFGLVPGTFNILTIGFAQIAPGVENGFIHGTWTVSNNYQTTDFISFNYCGLNSCGKRIFCLRSLSDIHVLAKAATLAHCNLGTDCHDESFPTCDAGICKKTDLTLNDPQADFNGSLYDGVVDMAGNSLDGNHNGNAQGTPADDYAFDFNTSDVTLTTTPTILSRAPDADQQNVNNLNDPIEILFDRAMLRSTLKQDNTYPDGGRYITLTADPPAQPVGYWITSKDEPCANGTCTRAFVNHVPFEPEKRYTMGIGNDVKDWLQNCYSDCTGSCNIPVPPQH